MADVLPFPSLPDLEKRALADAETRQTALDIRRSFIVEAPAGSGKTGLLIQRFLKLLADPEVLAPEQVLAITFTRKATAEMRDRILAHLHAAEHGPEAGEAEFARETRTLALAVLERDRQLGWSLLDQPARLRIGTIDSLCAEIARMLPVLSGSGGRLSPTERAQPMYREAARRVMLQLGSSDRVLHAAIHEVLLHRDGYLADCEQLIADMLGLREQWGELIWGMAPDQQRHALDDAYLDTHVLPRLEAAMDEAVCAELEEVQRHFPPDVLEEVVALAADLTSNGVGEIDARIAACTGRSSSPRSCSADLEFWQALVHVLVTPSAKTWRKSLGARTFGVELQPGTKARLQRVLSDLNDRDELLDLLCGLRMLPPARYPADQWHVAKALFRVLSRAMVELQIVFAERNECDFAELSLLARHALSQSSGVEDLAEAAGSNLQHLLVDEMQDTSSSQYQLLEVLTRSWDGSSQTVFLVGDPRQSIYLFRQARVERFLQSVRQRRLGDLPLTHLKLSSNFRSQHRLVCEFNRQFSAIFPLYSDPLPYTDAEPVLPETGFAAGIEWHASVIPHASKTTEPTLAQLQQQQRRTNAQEIVRIAQRWFDTALPEGRRTVLTSQGGRIAEPWRVAVLVRSRSHLAEIVPALREAGISYRAVNIEVLNERQEILDLSGLTRALLHPADRVAWLAIARAPWCGLTLADLHMLTGADAPLWKESSIPHLLAERGNLLSEDGQRRAAGLQQVLATAAVQRGRLTTAQLVEKTWRTLGGDVSLSREELVNTDRFFDLLSELEQDSQSVNLTTLEGRLRDLYAEPAVLAPETPHVELLTIHKAKGLEWDVVMVPGLERLPDRTRGRLLAWTTLDRGNDEASASVMLAPIAAKDNDADSLTAWLNGMQRKREIAEHKRLYYVACTRAREELHLFASPVEGAKGEVKPKPGSLLQAAWPAARRYFDQPALPALVRTAEKDGLLQIAASATVSQALRPASRLKRLPESFDSAQRFAEARRNRLPYQLDEPSPETVPFERPEGSYAARAFGNLVHGAMELLASRAAEESSTIDLLTEVRGWQPRFAALLRADGLPQRTVQQLSAEALKMLVRVLSDDDGMWVVGPHANAASEFSRSTEVGGKVATLRADRIFWAGPAPRVTGENCFWIIDYKTSAPGGAGLDAFLARQREFYASQLEGYAKVLGPMVGARQIRVGLYFPALPRLLWWEPEAVSS
jgi:ATP-dependent helicase/nuclease subunit A